MILALNILANATPFTSNRSSLNTTKSLRIGKETYTPESTLNWTTTLSMPSKLSDSPWTTAFPTSKSISPILTPKILSTNHTNTLQLYMVPRSNTPQEKTTDPSPRQQQHTLNPIHRGSTTLLRFCRGQQTIGSFQRIGPTTRRRNRIHQRYNQPDTWLRCHIYQQHHHLPCQWHGLSRPLWYSLTQRKQVPQPLWIPHHGLWRRPCT